jgi:hypothetical protein
VPDPLLPDPLLPSGFLGASSVRGEPSEGFRWDVPDGWQQGRGAWGGLVVGAIVRAIQASEPDPSRQLRSLTVQIVAPARVGTHHIDVRPVRIGGAMSTWSATIMGQGEVCASAVVILGAARQPTPGLGVAGWQSVQPPSAPPADDVPIIPFVDGLSPVFAQHYEARPVSGVPFGGGAAESVGWIRFAEPTPWTAASLLALVDAWWPASLAVVTEMPRIATVNFFAALDIDPATVPPHEPLLHHSFVTGAVDGFTTEHRRLWTADGRLVADNVQTIVVGS